MWYPNERLPAMIIPGHCHLCPEDVPDIVEHLRLLHPAEYGDGPERWPDGTIVFHMDDVDDFPR